MGANSLKASITQLAYKQTTVKRSKIIQIVTASLHQRNSHPSQSTAGLCQKMTKLCWARFPISGAMLPPDKCCLHQCWWIWQPEQPSVCANSLAALAHLHPALESRQMVIEEKRKKTRHCVVLMYVLKAVRKKVKWKRQSVLCSNILFTYNNIIIILNRSLSCTAICYFIILHLRYLWIVWGR